MNLTVRNTLIRVALKYGAIGGIIVLSLIVFLYLMNKNPLGSARYSDLIVLLLFVFFSIKEYRNIYNNNVLHFWQGLSIGAITTLTIAVISSIGILLICLRNPELLSEYIVENLDVINQNKEMMIETFDERAYVDTIRGLQETTILDMALDDFLKKTLIGLTLSVIISIILRKNPL